MLQENYGEYDENLDYQRATNGSKSGKTKDFMNDGSDIVDAIGEIDVNWKAVLGTLAAAGIVGTFITLFMKKNSNTSTARRSGKPGRLGHVARKTVSNGNRRHARSS